MTEENSDGAAAELFVSQPPVHPSPHPHSFKPGDPVPQGVLLDINDPYERAMMDVIRLYRHRRPTLQVEGNIFETYAATARALDIPYVGVPETLLLIIQREQAHINAMRKRGSLFSPESDAVASYLEMAFNANMLLAWIKEWNRVD